MKDYKGLIKNKKTKEKKIVYMLAPNLEGFKNMIKGSYKDVTIVYAKLNKDISLHNYCNTCEREYSTREEGTRHRH